MRYSTRFPLPRGFAAATPAAGGGADRSFRGIVGPVRWTLPYIGLLVYLFAIITYRLPIGNVGMIVALIGVALQRERFRFPPFLVWLTLFLAWGLVGYVQTPYSAEVWERLILLGKLGLIALVIVNALRTPAQIRFLLIYFLLLFATHPARGAIFNYFFHGYTLFGRALWNHIFRNPNDLAALTLLPLAIAAILLKDHNHWVRLGARASVIALPILILMTQSRGAFIGLALFVFLTVMGQQKRRLRSLLTLGALCVVVVTIAPGGVWDRVGGLPEATETDSSARQRKLIWQVAGEIIRDNAVTGVGLGAYPRAHASYAARNPDYAFARGNRDTHGTYHNLAAEAGYPGLLLFLGLLIATLLRADRARRQLKKAGRDEAVHIWYLQVGLLGFMAAGVFATYWQLSFLYFHLALMTVLADSLRREFGFTQMPRTRYARSSLATRHLVAQRIA